MHASVVEIFFLAGPLPLPQFPDDAYISDTILVAIISVCVLFPVSGILAQLMELSNTVKASKGWQATPSHKILRTLLGGVDGHRSWHWFFPEGQKKSLFARRKPMSPGYRWLLDNGDTPLIVLLWEHVQSLVQLITAAVMSLVVGRDKGNEEERKQEAARAARARGKHPSSASGSSAEASLEEEERGEAQEAELEEEDPLVLVERDYTEHLALHKQQRWFLWVRSPALFA